jgi:6,7-dimethyl-8-ribityllumazine synthase
MDEVPHILILDARFYEDVADQLVEGAVARLEAAGVTHERVSVPGAYELPTALHMAVRSLDFFAGRRRYDGYVILGCVIRGETSHYDYVCGESARKLQDLGCDYLLALGYGILTCETKEQAMERARLEGRDKGGQAAATCLEMIALKRHFRLYPR